MTTPSLALLKRPRRLRRSPAIRDLVQETRLHRSDLVAPLFVKDKINENEPIPSMPGIERLTPTNLIKEAKELFDLGIKGIALFPCIDPKFKDDKGSHALQTDNLMLQSIQNLKKEVPDLVLITDVALDPYTTHGHDGLINENGIVLNDETVEVLCQMAVLQAQAGADIIAPSDMMDGRVRQIRQALDRSDFIDVSILAYSAKYASAYYGPFRDAVGSSLPSGVYLDKKTYQLNPANPRESIADALLDEEEGADLLMIKPAGPYLDILSQIRQHSRLPLAAYQVSGEYAQLQAAAEKGWLDLRSTRDESLLAIKRAGADIILTYFAKAFALDELKSSSPSS